MTATGRYIYSAYAPLPVNVDIPPGEIVRVLVVATSDEECLSLIKEKGYRLGFRIQERRGNGDNPNPVGVVYEGGQPVRSRMRSARELYDMVPQGIVPNPFQPYYWMRPLFGYDFDEVEGNTRVETRSVLENRSDSSPEILTYWLDGQPFAVGHLSGSSDYDRRFITDRKLYLEARKYLQSLVPPDVASEEVFDENEPMRDLTTVAGFDLFLAKGIPDG